MVNTAFGATLNDVMQKSKRQKMENFNIINMLHIQNDNIEIKIRQVIIKFPGFLQLPLFLPLSLH